MLACFISLRKRINLRISRLNSKKKAAKLNLQLFLNLLSRQDYFIAIQRVYKVVLIPEFDS